MRRLLALALLVPCLARAATDNFPTTGALSGSWTSIVTGDFTQAMTVTSANAVGPDAWNIGLAIYTGSSFSGDQSSQVTVNVGPANNNAAGVCVRMSTGGSGYCYDGNGSLYKYTSGSASGGFLVGGCGAPTVGQTIKFTATGTTLTAYVNGTQVCQTTDSTYSSGYPGFMVVNGNSATPVVTVGSFVSTGDGPAAAATPTASPAAGTVAVPLDVTLSSGTTGATICYTTDGSTPTADGAGTCTAGTTYSTPIHQGTTGSLTVKAIASASGYLDSSVATFSYTVNQWVYVGAGTLVNTTGNQAVALPSGDAANDVCLLAAVTRDAQTHSITGATGWAQLAQGNQGGSTGAQFSLWWKRLTSGSETNPTLSRSTSTARIEARTVCYRGASQTSDPYVGALQGNTTTAGAALGTATPAVTTTDASSMVLHVLGLTNSTNATAAVTSPTGVNGTTYSPGFSAGGTSTTRTGLALYSTIQASAGSSGTSSLTTTQADQVESIHVAIPPYVESGGAASATLSAQAMTAAQASVSSSGAAASTLGTQAAIAGQAPVSAAGGAAATLPMQAVAAAQAPVSSSGAAASSLGPQSMTAAQAAVSASGGGAASATLSPQAMTAGQASVTASGAAARTLAGQGATAAQSSVSAAGGATASIAAQAATAGQASVASSGAAARTLVGQAATVAQGPVSASGGASSALVAQAAAAGQTSVSAAGAASASLTGQGAMVAQTSVSASAGGAAAATLTAQAMTAAQAPVTSSGAASRTLAPQGASAAQVAVTASGAAARALAAQAMTAAQAPVSASGGGAATATLSPQVMVATQAAVAGSGGAAAALAVQSASAGQYAVSSSGAASAVLAPQAMIAALQPVSVLPPLLHALQILLETVRPAVTLPTSRPSVTLPTIRPSTTITR